MKRAGVVEDAALDQALEILGDLLCGDLDLVRGDPGGERAFGLVAAAGVDVQTLVGEHAQDAAVRGRFHGVATDERAG